MATPAQATDRGSRRSLRLVLPSPGAGLPQESMQPGREYPPRWPARVMKAAGTLSLALGLLVVIGWHTGHILSPTALWFESVPVRYNAGICFACGGLALLLLTRGKLGLARFAAMPMALLGLLTGCEYLLNLNFGIDELFFRGTRLAPAAPPRMAPNTALCFSLLGGVLLLTRKQPKALHNGLQALAAGLAMAMGLVGFIGYVADIPTAYGWGRLTPMAAPTAAVMVAVGLGVIAFAWRQYAASSPSMPGWSPLLAGVTLAAGSVALGQALHALHPRSGLDVLALAVGLVQAALLYLVLQLLRGTRERARELRQLNSVLQVQMASLERAEREVHDKQAYTRSLIEASLDPLVTIARDGRITDVNAATEAATGRGRQELIGTDFSDYFTQPEKARAGYQQVFREGGVRDYELEIRHGDGRLTPVLYNASLYHDQAGEVVGVFAAARDISERKRGEQALRQSEERYRALLLATAQVVWTTPADGLVEDMPMWREYTGQSLEEVRGWGWLNAIHPEDRRGTEAAWAEALAARSMYETEYRIRRSDGCYRHFAVRGVPVLNEDGSIREWVGVCADIQERKRAEQELRASESRLQLHFDRMPVGCIVWSREFRVESWNPAAQEIFGFTAPQAIGKRPYEFLLPQSAVAEVEAVYRRLMEGDDTAHSENENLTQDGRRVMCAWTNTPLRSPAGEVTGILSMVQDITLRKQAEEELRKQAALLNLAHDAILVRDLHQQILYWNRGAQEVYGWKAQEAIGRPIHELLQTESDTGLEVNEQAVQRDGEWEGELKQRTRDGRILVVASRWSLQCDPRGAPVNILEINRDISERKRLEDSLRQRTLELENSVAELEAFSYSVSHDLRAPLRSIDGFSQILLEDYHQQVDQEGQDCLRRIRVASQNMGQLIDALLQLSRVMRSELQREPVDLSVLALSTAALIQKAEPLRQVRFHIASGLQARGDRRLLGVALQNLLQNAWKFTAHNSEPVIEFGSTQKDGKPAYYVRDNGIGFDMAYVNKLFTPFQRLHAQEQFEGTGIGLATVLRVIKRHGGRVWAEGAVGQGATFYFSLQ